jgi:hypothetical protein
MHGPIHGFNDAARLPLGASQLLGLPVERPRPRPRRSAGLAGTA